MPAPIAGHELRVGREHAGTQHLAQTRRRLDGPSALKDLADWLVADAGQLQQAIVDEHLPDGHLVPRQCARLVGADDRRAAQRLDDRQPPNEGVALDHPPEADRQRNGHDGRKRLGNGRHRQRDAKEEHVDDREAAGDADDDHDRDHRECGLAERAPEAIEIDL